MQAGNRRPSTRQNQKNPFKPRETGVQSALSVALVKPLWYTVKKFGPPLSRTDLPEGVFEMKKIAIITGASSGMGKTFAETISTYDTFDEVWVIARRLDRLEALS